MAVERTLVDGVRHYYPVSSGQVAAARKESPEDLGMNAYIRVKGERHAQFSREFESPPQSWRTRWRKKPPQQPWRMR